MKKLSGPILEISNICKNVKNKNIEKLNISVAKNDSFAVLHKNPENIELLTDILQGRIKPQKGKVFFKGDDVTGTRNVFGVVERKHDIPKAKTVLDFASVPVVKRGLSRSMTGILVRKEIESFSLSEYGSEVCGKLPQNIAFRAELFSAYMCSHEMIVIDEPFFGLEESKRNEELERLGNLKEKLNFTLLFFTDNIETVLKLANTVMVVNDKTESVGILSLDKKRSEKNILKIRELYDSI